MVRFDLRVPVVVLALVALAPVASAGSAHFTAIDYPDAVATVALGINPAGDVVGGYALGEDDEHGFLLRNGTFTSFDYPGAAWTEFEAINPEGDIAGQYGLADGTIHGFLIRNGTVTQIEVTGQPNSMPFGINPEGTIVGCVHGGPSGMHGFERTADGVIEVQGVAATMHTGINASGSIVGYKNGTTLGYVIVGGVESWFSFPGSSFTHAWGIGATGDIVGVFKDATTKALHGFLLRDGAFVAVDVDAPGVTETQARGITPGGNIVGYYADATGYHGFVRDTR